MSIWTHACKHPLCMAADRAGPGGTAEASRTVTGVQKTGIVDLHCHVMTPGVELLVAQRPEKQAEAHAMLLGMGASSVAHNSAVMLPQAFPKLTRLDQRLAEMDAMGVDVQVMSPSPTQYCYWADSTLAAELVLMQNEHIAQLCAQQPTRLAGLGTVSLQHPDLACEQLQHAIQGLGLRGVEISTSVNGQELSDPAFCDLWRTAEALGALIFIHPFGTTLGARTRSHYLSNTIGQPLETAIALSHLIFHGVLDRHPSLKILAAHGGGYLPTSIGRSDHAHKVRPEAAADSTTPPSDHLKRIWFDSVVYDGLALRHLIDRVGASQVVIGTDYPFDMGHYQPQALVAAVPGLSAVEQDAILRGNARRLLGWAAHESTH